MENTNLDAVIAMFKNDPYLSRVIEKNRIDDATIKKYFLIFNESFNSFTKCKNCPGLDKCTQDNKGEVITISYDGQPLKVIRYCKHRVAYDNLITLQNKYVYTDIPKPLYSINLDNLNPLDQYQELLFKIYDDIARGIRKKGVFLIGDYGVGKSYFSCALANTLVNQGNRVAFIKTNSFCTDMSTLLVNNNEAYEKRVNDIKNCDFVIFDDIGTENVTEFSRDRLLYNILDHRMENRLCTIFTSNFDIETLQKHFTLKGYVDTNAERICNRISSLTDEYVLEGESKRNLYD